MSFVFAPRTLLYVPADNARALQKARELQPDGLILDLEDAVAPERKDLAREQARAALQQGFSVPALVRVNGLDTPWEHLDREMALTAGAAGLVLPKVEDPALVRGLSLGVPLWLLIETPLGVLRAAELAAQEGVAGLLVGSNDLASALHAQPGPERSELQYALQAVVLAARAHGKYVLDAVYNDTRDLAGFEAQCQQGRRLGFDGKTLIHPAQIAPAQNWFGVSGEQAQAAQALLSAWEQARAEGKSVLSYGGQMVEELHIRQARALLARYEQEQHTRHEAARNQVV